MRVAIQCQAAYLLRRHSCVYVFVTVLICDSQWLLRHVGSSPICRFVVRTVRNNQRSKEGAGNHQSKIVNRAAPVVSINKWTALTRCTWQTVAQAAIYSTNVSFFASVFFISVAHVAEVASIFLSKEIKLIRTRQICKSWTMAALKTSKQDWDRSDVYT